MYFVLFHCRQIFESISGTEIFRIFLNSFFKEYFRFTAFVKTFQKSAKRIHFLDFVPLFRSNNSLESKLERLSKLEKILKIFIKRKGYDLCRHISVKILFVLRLFDKKTNAICKTIYSFKMIALHCNFIAYNRRIKFCFAKQLYLNQIST